MNTALLIVDHIVKSYFDLKASETSEGGFCKKKVFALKKAKCDAAVSERQSMNDLLDSVSEFLFSKSEEKSVTGEAGPSGPIRRD